jgi:O-antigen/teichoic acid export membrane protein
MTFIRFFLFNLIGNVLPILTALVAVPVIAHYSGVDRLGALGVVWGLIGYFGFLDFGLSRVVTRRVAIALEQNRRNEELTELRGFLWWWATPALIVITVLLVFSRAIFSRFFPSGWMGTELNDGWIWICLCIPITLLTNWVRGALEGAQRFARVNLMRTVFGAWNYAAPAAVVLIAPTLTAMIAVIALGRLLALLAHAWACLQVEPEILVGHAPRRLASGRLFFQEGGWMTVSNLIAPLMVYSDRFVLAALLPTRAVAWYVTSQEVMLRTLMIPAALAGVLFPKFSEATNAPLAATVFGLYQRSIRLISAMMLPICTLATVLAYDALSVWLGEPFALHSHRVVEIISIGIFVASIGQLPFAWLQGLGRSSVTARIHMVELPVYAIGLYLSVKYAGIEGAAWMWTIRVSVDCLLLLMMATQLGRRPLILIAICGAMFICLAGYMTGPERDLQWRLSIAAMIAMASLLAAWFGLLNREDRNEIGRLRHAN